MAESSVNPQITDAVTQTNVKVVAEAPAQSIAALYQVAGQATGLAMQNATANQHALNDLMNAIVAKGSQMIMSISAG